MSTPVILPGKTIGILGSGQLGRMLAMAAKRMGYTVHVYSPDAGTPAGQVADVETTAAYEDTAALEAFAAQVDVVTLEFENIPTSALRAIEAIVPVAPQPHVLHITQNRLREKRFLWEQVFPVVPFREVRSLEDMELGLQELGSPCVLKTAGFGYDGKGQVKISSMEDAQSVWPQYENQAAILEQWIDLDQEISVIAARNGQGQLVAYPIFENRHRHHILDVTVVPASVSEEIAQQAINIARHLMERLEMRGLLCVEFFVDKQGQLLINELAPRPHNSGHVTIEACLCNQFEQQLRAVCGLPLGNTELRQPAAMANLLGDLWKNGEPDWAAALENPQVALHLYGKNEARSGRKMGHVTAVACTREEALHAAQQARAKLIEPAY